MAVLAIRVEHIFKRPRIHDLIVKGTSDSAINFRPKLELTKASTESGRALRYPRQRISIRGGLARIPMGRSRSSFPSPRFSASLRGDDLVNSQPTMNVNLGIWD